MADFRPEGPMIELSISLAPAVETWEIRVRAGRTKGANSAAGRGARELDVNA
jgi:hypothetical protein